MAWYYGPALFRDNLYVYMRSNDSSLKGKIFPILRPGFLKQFIQEALLNHLLRILNSLNFAEIVSPWCQVEGSIPTFLIRSRHYRYLL